MTTTDTASAAPHTLPEPPMPMHYDDESPEPLLLKLPPLPDELAVRMYELLQLFLEQYEERYLDQIQRFYYERDREQQELRAQMLFDQAQHSLPLEDDKPF
jgi:hypothetical protein